MGRSPAPATLRVSSPLPGSYTIYEATSSSGGLSQQLTAVEQAAFDQDIQLPAGTYFLATECSGIELSLAAGTRTERAAAALEWVAPAGITGPWQFRVGCSPHPLIYTKNNYLNQLAFPLLAPPQSMFAGGQPIQLASNTQTDLLERRPLGGIKLTLPAEIDRNGRRDEHFFVRGASDISGPLVSVNHTETLLVQPGDYVVALGGRERRVRVRASEVVEIPLVALRFVLAQEAAAYRRSNPGLRLPQIYLEPEYRVSLDTWSLLLDWPQYFYTDGSTHLALPTPIPPTRTASIPLSAVTVASNCAPYEHACIAKREVVVHTSGQIYPFIESFSDTLLLYVAGDIEVGLEGSKWLRRRVPAAQTFTLLHLGHVAVQPRPVVHPEWVTDLLRIDAKGEGQLGYSYDIGFESESSFPLLVGDYVLSRYSGSSLEGGERLHTGKGFRVQQGQKIQLEIPVYVTAARLARMEQLRPDSARSPPPTTLPPSLWF